MPAGPQVTLQPRRPRHQEAEDDVVLEETLQAGACPLSPPASHRTPLPGRQHQFNTLRDFGQRSLPYLPLAPYTHALPQMVLVFHRQQAPLFKFNMKCQVALLTALQQYALPQMVLVFHRQRAPL